jgi:hypothetical protein
MIQPFGEHARVVREAPGKGGMQRLGDVVNLVPWAILDEADNLLPDVGVLRPVIAVWRHQKNLTYDAPDGRWGHPHILRDEGDRVAQILGRVLADGNLLCLAAIAMPV